MLKIADSAAIRHHMPTRPRISCPSGISDGGSATDVVAMRVSPLLVLPVRIFRMLQVPQRTAAAHHRLFREVIVRRRRTRAPLQRPRIPRIVSRWLSLEIRPHKIHHPEKNAGDLEDHPYRNNHDPDFPSPARFISINSV